MKHPSLTQSVIFVDGDGREHAAIVSRDADSDTMDRDLIVFALAGQAAFPMSAVEYSPEGAPGTWNWPRS